MIAQLISFAALAIAAPTGTTSFDRVITVVLEDFNYVDVIADPFLGQTLASKGRLFTNFFAIARPGQPNYLSMIGGSTFGVSSNNDTTVAETSIVDLIEEKGLDWKAYIEEYPGDCFTESASPNLLYRRKHNPFISFDNIRTNPARCAKIVNSASFASDIVAGTVPQYVFYGPNMKNNGHDTSIAYMSNWLQGWISPLLDEPLFASTLFVITFDESKKGEPTNQIYTVFIGPQVEAGTVDSNQYNFYHTLATIEENFGLGNLGRNDSLVAPIAF